MSLSHAFSQQKEHSPDGSQNESQPQNKFLVAPGISTELGQQISRKVSFQNFNSDQSLVASSVAPHHVQPNTEFKLAKRQSIMTTAVGATHQPHHQRRSTLSQIIADPNDETRSNNENSPKSGGKRSSGGGTSSFPVPFTPGKSSGHSVVTENKQEEDDDTIGYMPPTWVTTENPELISDDTQKSKRVSIRSHRQSLLARTSKSLVDPAKPVGTNWQQVQNMLSNMNKLGIKSRNQSNYSEYSIDSRSGSFQMASTQSLLEIQQLDNSLREINSSLMSRSQRQTSKIHSNNLSTLTPMQRHLIEQKMKELEELENYEAVNRMHKMIENTVVYLNMPGTINKNVPIQFNLSHMLSSHLLNELEYARYEKILSMILKRGGKLPKTAHGEKAALELSEGELKLLNIPHESKGIAIGLFRQGDAVLGNKRHIRAKSWNRSKEWAVKMAKTKNEKPRTTVEANRTNRATSVVEFFITTPEMRNQRSTCISVHQTDEEILKPGENVLSLLTEFSSRSKIASRPLLGKLKKNAAAEERKPISGSIGANGANDKQYEISDFVVIRKMSQNHYSTIRQVTLAAIPAVRRRPYAMKTISKKLLKTRDLIEAVKRERDIHLQLSSQFINKMLATFSTPKRLYSILEWSSTSLDALMGFQRSIKEENCRGIVAEIVLGLEYLHAHGVLHRGLEPGNLQLDVLGHIKISDFSTAVLLADNPFTEDKKCLRLTRYSAPELILGETHGKCVDWFSLGTILYEMLTGNVPFGQGNVLDTLAAQYGGSNTRKKPKKKDSIIESIRSSITDDRKLKTEKYSSNSDEPTIPSRIRTNSVGGGNKLRETTRRKSMKAEELKAAEEEEGVKIRMVAGIALTGKNTVQLPYLYRNISEHYKITRPGEDLVRRMMEPDQTHRITTMRGIVDVKMHPWFRPLNLTWKEIEEGKIKPIYSPGGEADDTFIVEFMKNKNKEEGVAATVGKLGGKAVMQGKDADDDDDIINDDYNVRIADNVNVLTDT
ncbi:hypothetical protein HK100_003623, partial [Physocladia obscura]